jgi:hypothetical protein
MEISDIVEITWNKEGMTISTIPAENAVHTDTYRFRKCCLCGKEVVFYSKYGWLGHGNVERCDSCGTSNIQMMGEHGGGSFMLPDDFSRT